MATARVTYQGELRCSCEHVKSGTQINTDAPTDNHGKGEAFSPTDTVASALASCMLTVMAIKAEQLEIDLKGSTADVVKTMGVSPRRIVRIDVALKMNVKVDRRQQLILERIALTCPVYQSLHPEMSKEITFSWL